MLGEAILMLMRGSTGLPLDHGGWLRSIEERLQDPAEARRATRRRLRTLISPDSPHTTRFPTARRDGTLATTPCS